MISGINPAVSEFNQDINGMTAKVSYDSEIGQNENGNSIHKIRVSDEKKSRILLYDSFDSLEIASNQLTLSKIKHKFHIMPALTTTAIWGYEVPLDGLTSETENTKTVTTAVEQKNTIGDIYGTGFDLDFTADAIGVSVLHDLNLTGEGIEVAIIDSGVNPNLQSFINNGVSRVNNWNVPEIPEDLKISNHATHVAGIMGGNGKYTINGNTEQYESTGMAPNSIIHSLRVLDTSGFGEITWVYQGMEKAIDLGVDIMSLSLSSELYNGSSNDIHEEVVKRAIDAGIIVVSAAGNQGPIGSGIGIPGALEQVISVGASNFIKTNDRTIIGTYQFSAIGPRINDFPGPDLVAPGVDILSVDEETGGVRADTGTSMATPHVSGGIALLKEAFPNATIHQIREALLASAKEMRFSEPVEKVGRGFVDFAAAYEILKNTTRTSLNSNTFAMSSSPRDIKDENLYFRHQISTKSKTLPFYIHSSRNITLKPVVDMGVTNGVDFEFPNTIDVKAGLNKYNMNITITTKDIKFIYGQIYFEDDLSKNILPYANMSYSSLVRYAQADILFDSSKDFDTKSKTYFGGHSPRGQFSLYVSNLENEGHTVDENRFNNITVELLENYDVLIMANPDLSYNPGEISAIRDFVYVQSKSLMIIAGGGLISAETQTYDRFNANSLALLLDGSGMDFRRNEQGQTLTSIYGCSEVGIADRSSQCYNNAETSKNQDVLSKLVKFPQYGPELVIKDDTDTSTVHQVALIDGKSVILASELEGGGRILLFSSPLVFDNKAQLYGYESSIEAEQVSNNKRLSTEAIDWLIELNSINVQYSINGKNVGNEANINLHERNTIRLTVTNININVDALNVTLVERIPNTPLVFKPFQMSRINPNVFEIENFGFTEFGSYEFFVDLQDPDGILIATDAHLTISVALQNFYDQDEISSIAFYLYFALMISWIIFVYNEGGRKLSLKKKAESEIAN